MPSKSFFALLGLVTVLFVAPASAAAPAPSFETEILPIFKQSCLACHGQEPFQGELDLSSLEGVLRGGKSGTAVAPGASDRSLLLKKIVGGSMPPMDPRLTNDQVDRIRGWIDHGLNQETAASGPPVTEKDVLPIFQLRCAKCHGKRRQEAGLDLRTLAARLKGGKSGPALVPGDPEDSLLFQRIIRQEMPPTDMLFESQVRPPIDSEVEVLRKWIAGGALPEPLFPTTMHLSRTPSITHNRKAAISGRSVPRLDPRHRGSKTKRRCATRSTLSCSTSWKARD